MLLISGAIDWLSSFKAKETSIGVVVFPSMSFCGLRICQSWYTGIDICVVNYPELARVILARCVVLFCVRHIGCVHHVSWIVCHTDLHLYWLAKVFTNHKHDIEEKTRCFPEKIHDINSISPTMVLFKTTCNKYIESFRFASSQPIIWI